MSHCERYHESRMPKVSSVTLFLKSSSALVTTSALLYKSVASTPGPMISTASRHAAAHAPIRRGGAMGIRLPSGSERSTRALPGRGRRDTRCRVAAACRLGGRGGGHTLGMHVYVGTLENYLVL